MPLASGSLGLIFALLGQSVPGPCPGASTVTATTAPPLDVAERGQILGAVGFDHLIAGDLEAATACLEAAFALLPGSVVIARDLALVHHRAGRAEEAERLIRLALALGDVDPEAHQLYALILAERGERDGALEATARAGTWEADLIGAALDDPRAAQRAQVLMEEEGARGALASLVLAAREGGEGELLDARRLIDLAERQALTAGAASLVGAARALAGRLDRERGAPVAGFRFRTAVDHTTNPRFEPSGAAPRSAASRLSLTGEGAVRFALGGGSAAVAVRLDQHVFLVDRLRHSDLDITAYSVALALEYPLSRHPNALVVGLAARFTDVFARLFRHHYATTLEGGPTLGIRLGGQARLELGFFGVATDFIDGSPRRAVVSSVNRDSIGQRATAALLVRGDWIDARLETMFLRDDAYGDAFDAIGGAVAGRVEARPLDGITLRTGVAVTVQELGPVGDRAVIGKAATRTEVRTLVELGARVRLAEQLYFVLEDVWIRSSARAGHGYVENVLSMGMEVLW